MQPVVDFGDLTKTLAHVELLAAQLHRQHTRDAMPTYEQGAVSTPKMKNALRAKLSRMYSASSSVGIIDGLNKTYVNTIRMIVEDARDFTKVCADGGCGSPLHLQPLFGVGQAGACAGSHDCATASMLKHWMYCAINWATMPTCWIYALEVALIVLGDAPLSTATKARFEQVVAGADPVALLCTLPGYYQTCTTDDDRALRVPLASDTFEGAEVERHAPHVERRLAGIEPDPMSPELLAQHDELMASTKRWSAIAGCEASVLQALVLQGVGDGDRATRAAAFRQMQMGFLVGDDTSLPMAIWLARAPEDELAGAMGSESGPFAHMFRTLGAHADMRMACERNLCLLRQHAAAPEPVPTDPVRTAAHEIVDCAKMRRAGLLPAIEPSLQKLAVEICTKSRAMGGPLLARAESTKRTNVATARDYSLLGRLASVLFRAMHERGRHERVASVDPRDKLALPREYLQPRYVYNTMRGVMHTRVACQRHERDDSSATQVFLEANGTRWVVSHNANVLRTPGTVRVSYDRCRNCENNVKFDAFSPGADTLGCAEQSSAMHKIDNMLKVVRAMLKRRCTPNELDRFATALDVANQFDARAFTAFAQSVNSCVPVATAAGPFFDLLHSVGMHMQRLAARTGHTERYPYSISRWFLWLLHKRDTFANIQHLGHVLTPMCGPPTPPQQGVDELVDRHVCTYCRELHTGAPMSAHFRHRCTEHPHFTGGVHQKESYATPHQTKPYTTTIFATTCHTWSHSRANTRELMVLPGFGDEMCGAGSNRYIEATTLLFGKRGRGD